MLWINLGKVTKWLISLANFYFGYFYFVYNLSFGQVWVKTAECSIRIENFDFGTRFTNYGVPFCSTQRRNYIELSYPRQIDVNVSMWIRHS